MPVLPYMLAFAAGAMFYVVVEELILGQYVKKKGEQLKSDALIASGSDTCVMRLFRAKEKAGG